MGSSRIARNIYGKTFLNFLLSYLASSQIWRNLPMDDTHFISYITKLATKIIGLEANG
jgi:hypothetical protein